MNRPNRLAFIVAATVLGSGLFIPSETFAGGNSGWGWAKPINKRMGAFYTSNKNANFSRQSSKRSSSSSYHRRLPATPPYHAAPESYVPQHHPPRVAVPVSPPPATTLPATALPTPTQPNRPVAIWSVAPTPAPSALVAPPQNTFQYPATTAAKKPPRPALDEPLPHLSTTDSFWQ